MRRSIGGLFVTALLLLNIDTGRFAADSVCRQDDGYPGTRCGTTAHYTRGQSKLASHYVRKITGISLGRIEVYNRIPIAVDRRWSGGRIYRRARPSGPDAGRSH